MNIFMYLINFMCLRLVCGSPFMINKRGMTMTDLMRHKSAILAVDGQVTSCEVVLLGEKAGYVAANCFKYDKSMQLVQTKKYDVYVNKNVLFGPPTVYSLDLSDIHVHPGYNPDTFANNVAVIEFNKQAPINFETYGYTGSLNYSGTVLVRRPCRIDGPIMLPPELDLYITDSNECAKYSGLAASNSDWIGCSTQTVNATEKPNCQTPYSSIFSNFTAGLAYVGIYSHSVIIGKDTCSSTTKWVNYYTFLKNYRDFAYSVLQYPVQYINGNQIVSYSGGKQPPTPNQPRSVDLSGTSIYGGNLFVQYLNRGETAKSTATGSANSASNNNNNSNNKNSISKALSLPSNASSPTNSPTTTNTLPSINISATGSATDNLSKSGHDKDNQETFSNITDNSDNSDNSNSDNLKVFEDQSKDIPVPILDNDSIYEDNSDTNKQTKSKKKVTVSAIVVSIVALIVIVGSAVFYWIRKQRKLKEKWDQEDARLNEFFSSPRKRVRSSNPLDISRPSTLPLRDDAKLVTYVDIKPNSSIIQELENRFAGLKSKFSFSLPLSDKSNASQRS